MEPEFSDIVSLHSMISRASAATAHVLVKSCEPGMIHAILSTYVLFFMDRSNRERYLDPDHPRSSMHASILNASLSKLLTRRRQSKAHSYFDRLPTLLLSQCISFLKQSDRVCVSKVSMLCMKASSEPIAKHHLCLTPTFIKREMMNSPEHFRRMNRFSALEVLEAPHISLGPNAWNYGKRARKQKKANYQHNLQSMVASNRVRRFEGGVPRDSADILNQYLKGTDVLVLAKRSQTHPAKSILLSTKKVVSHSASVVQIKAGDAERDDDCEHRHVHTGHVQFGTYRHSVGPNDVAKRGASYPRIVQSVVLAVERSFAQNL